MNDNRKERSISLVAALLVLAVFAAGIMCVLLSGVSAYRRLTLRDQSDYASRTCAQYITTKLRQASAPDAVSVSAFGDADALCITENLDGEDYITRVYCHSGWLMELFCSAQGVFSPEDGEKILPLQSLSLQQKGSTVTADLTDAHGQTVSLTLMIRGREEGLP